jgi:hypothetical protein
MIPFDVIQTHWMATARLMMIISSVFLFEIYKSLTRQNEIVFFSILFSRCNARAYYLVQCKILSYI